MTYLKAVLLVLVATFAFGFQSSPKMRECGPNLGGHPCQCILHVQEVQAKHMNDCLRERLKENNPPVDDAKACIVSMPDHCSIVEHYGNWDTDEQGEHVSPMPKQCTGACTKAHCLCSDGPVCHFAHSPQDDAPPQGKRR